MAVVAAVGMCKDEADIVEATVRQSLTQVDYMLVADNMSTDGSRDILDRIARETGRLVVIDDFVKAYYQSEKMTGWSKQAHLMFGAEWVVPIDMDEIWFSPYGRIGTTLGELADQWLVMEAKLYDHVATALDDQSVADPVARMEWRRKKEAPLRKVACRWREDLSIAQGNHSAKYNGGATIAGAEFVIRHFPIRSVAQFVRKARNGAEAYAAAHNIPADQGAHWREWGAMLARDGEAPLKELFQTYYWRDRPAETIEMDGITEPPLMHDPAYLAL